MHNTSPKILIAGANHWKNCIHVGTHHYAKAFRKLGFEVLFLSDPVSPFHILGRNRAEFSEKISSVRATYDMETGIQYMTPFSFFTPNSFALSNTDFVMRNWWRWCVPSLKKNISKAGFDTVDILYFDSPRFHFLLDILTYKKSVLRVADNISGFPGHTQVLHKAEQFIASRVDLTIYTATQLESYAYALGAKRALHVPNGVDFEHIAAGQNMECPSELLQLKGPKFLYIGAIAEWFDFELVEKAARSIPEGHFIFIGPPDLAKQRLGHLPNIHILGRRKFSEIPAYLWHSTVGIIPFDVKKYPELIHSVNPLKMYEYMAACLPVVSVAWDELLYLKPPAFMAHTHETFINALHEAAQQYPLRSNQEYARTLTWDSKAQLIINSLYKE